jgi:hypothetical protein
LVCDNTKLAIQLFRADIFRKLFFAIHLYFFINKYNSSKGDFDGYPP